MTKNYNHQIPNIINKSSENFNTHSYLLKQRTIFIGDEINDYMANEIVSQLLFLGWDEPKQDIFIYINSPGGQVTSGMAVYDVMQYVKPDIQTICIGQASSMGAILLTAGAAKKRFALPHSRIMIHQPSGGYHGKQTDIEIRTKEITRVRAMTDGIIAKHTGNSISQVNKDTERDYFMNAKEAKKYGLIDGVVKKIKHKKMRNKNDTK